MRVESLIMLCPKCKASKIHKDGKRKGKQAYRCAKCNHQFCPQLKGKPGRPKNKSVAICHLCSSTIFAKGLCQKHYRQMRRKSGKDLVSVNNTVDDASKKTF